MLNMAEKFLLNSPRRSKAWLPSQAHTNTNTPEITINVGVGTNWVISESPIWPFVCLPLPCAALQCPAYRVTPQKRRRAIRALGKESTRKLRGRISEGVEVTADKIVGWDETFYWSALRKISHILAAIE